MDVKFLRQTFTDNATHQSQIHVGSGVGLLAKTDDQQSTLARISIITYYEEHKVHKLLDFFPINILPDNETEIPCVLKDTGNGCLELLQAN